ncbi:hypothetical protein HY256_03485, partial [Candidatus Sumerlaeota bacterium]|nr:hypothetical protein [Candidatus Sumerlaeota bacterium]
MKKSIVAKAICLLTASIMLSVPGAFAKKGGGGGGGKGQTKIDFSLTLGNPATSRLFAKRDVAAGVAQLPEVGSASKNDNLAGQVVAVYFGDSLTTGTADSRGKVTVPFEAKLTANGRNMQVTIKGLDLETIMGINPLDGTYVTVVP